MLKLIRSKPKTHNFTITLATAISISRLLLFGAGPDTVSAGVSESSRGFDVGSRHDKPEGVWSDGETMWILDDREDRSELYAYRLATGARVPEKDIDLSSNNDKPQGITSDGTIVWVADWDETKLFAYNMETQSRVSRRDINLTSSNDAPRGIALDHSYMYVVDRYDRKVYVYSVSNGHHLANESFSLHPDNDQPWGVWAPEEPGNQVVWVGDFDDDAVYRYDLAADTASRGFRFPIGNKHARGIWSDGKRFWIVDDDDDHVYSVIYEGFRREDADIAITEPTDPKGIWTDGTTMWVADPQTPTSKLLSYNMSDGSRSDEDFTLVNYNSDPVAMWSDGSHIWVLDDEDDTLYAYLMGPGRTLDLAASQTLDPENAHPTGIWSNGRTMWVADDSDLKLYAYRWPAMTRRASRDISLHEWNGDPHNIWSDGEHIWVLDVHDENAYAYNLKTGERVPDQEFRPIPDSYNLSGGLTGHRQQVWILDTQDEKIYGYAKRNVPASFASDTVSLQIHHRLAGGGLVGAVPPATDRDGDSLIYKIRGGASNRFTMDRQTGEIHSRSDATFSGGESLSFEATVHDGKGLIDSTDRSTDDSITVYVEVLHNADPVFVTPDGATFSVAENSSETDVLADLDASDADGDTLVYGLTGPSQNPFQVTAGQVKLKAGESLDYEGTASYDLDVRVRDGKDANDGVDTSWDDEISITIEVTNVDEAGTVTLESNNPEVNIAVSASLTDPDGSVTDLAWQWQKADTADATTWSDISGATSAGYTPVVDDVGKFIRAEATYDDGEGDDKTAVAAAGNAVLADTPANQSPSFAEGATATRSVNENAQPGDLLGAPVIATDPDPDDTLDYRLFGPYSPWFDVDFATGQVSINQSTYLDYERTKSWTVTVWVRDKKDSDGADDLVFDASISLTINVIDVDEDDTVELSVESPRLAHEISAELEDPDEPVSNLVWQWQRADTADAATWSDIAGATAAEYTPVFDDHGKFLRARATYDDKHGTGKIVHGTTTNAVPQRPANQPPEFGEGTTATRTIGEDAVTGARLGAAVAASDNDGDALTYSLASGSDAGNFAIDPGTGTLKVARGALLDFETKPSLSVVVQVSDGMNASHNPDTAIDDTITVTVNLTNADERGRVSLSPEEPVSGTAVVASLTDPDGGETSITWQWAKSHDRGGAWNDIAGATSNTYTPETADQGALLRIIANYTDAEGPGKSVAVMSTYAVGDPTVVDTRLASLTLSGINLAFHSRTTQYGASAPYATTNTTVTATPVADSGVSVEITPQDSNPRQDGRQVNLAVGNNPITVTVTDDQTGSSTTYRVQVNRKRDMQGNQGIQGILGQIMNLGCRANAVDVHPVYCGSTSFAKFEMHMDGYYTVNWKKWDRRKSAVTGYTITVEQYMHKTYHRGNTEVSMSALANVYESCEFTDGSWNCQGQLRRNYHVDGDGQPTESRVVIDNVDQNRLSWSLDSTGVTTAQETFYRWNGDATDPNNLPTEVTYRTKTSEVDRYHFVPHTPNGDLNDKTITIAGRVFDDPFSP